MNKKLEKTDKIAFEKVNSFWLEHCDVTPTKEQITIEIQENSAEIYAMMFAEWLTNNYKKTESKKDFSFYSLHNHKNEYYNIEQLHEIFKNEKD